MTLNIAITNNDLEYVRVNRCGWDIDKPMHISTIEMCELLINYGWSVTCILSCVTTVELFNLVYKQHVCIDHYTRWLHLNNHTDVILQWIEKFPIVFNNHYLLYDIRPWLNCDRYVLIALNKCKVRIQLTLQIAIIDNATLIGTLSVRKLDHEMYKSFHELCVL